nr:hypothetical protein [Tanacetum cinerariifolium]
TSPSSPPPSLLPLTSRKRSKSPSPPLPPVSSPLQPFPLFEEMGHNIEIPQDDMGSSKKDSVDHNIGIPQDDIAEAAESRVEALQASLGAAQMDIIDLRVTMPTTRQGSSSAEIEQIIAQRVANSTEAIAIYEIKTRVARDSLDQVVRQGAKVAKNANKKRK